MVTISLEQCSIYGLEIIISDVCRSYIEFSAKLIVSTNMVRYLIEHTKWRSVSFLYAT